MIHIDDKKKYIPVIRKDLTIKPKHRIESRRNNKIPMVKNSSSANTIYGKKMSFSVSPDSKGFTKDTEDAKVEMYIPQLVQITNPAVNNDDEAYPLCMVDDFVLEWNADTENKNGLIVIVEYNGDNVNANYDTGEHIRANSYFFINISTINFGLNN